MIKVKEYMGIIDNNNIYAICKLVKKEKTKEFGKEFDIEVFTDENMENTKIVRYEKVDRVLMKLDFSSIYVKSFKINELCEKDREFLEKECPAEMKDAKKVYLCVDPFILINILSIIKLLRRNDVVDLIFDIHNMHYLLEFSNFEFYAPKERIAPIIVQDKIYKRYFAIIAPKILFNF